MVYDQSRMRTRCFAVGVFLINLINVIVSALLTCEPGVDGDEFCAAKYRPGSRCISSNAPSAENNETNSGTCSNPFVSGCLRNYLGEENFTRIRACNSDDDEGAVERGECAESEFGYKEIRILNQVSPIL